MIKIRLEKTTVAAFLLVFALGATSVYGAVQVISYRATVTSHVTVVPTGACPPDACNSLAVLNITAATSNGASCGKAVSVSANNQSVACPGFQVLQGFTLSPAYTVSVCNSGAADASVNLEATTTLAGSSVQPTLGASPPLTATVFVGTCLTWSLDYTAGQATGVDTVTIAVSAN